MLYHHIWSRGGTVNSRLLTLHTNSAHVSMIYKVVISISIYDLVHIYMVEIMMKTIPALLFLCILYEVYGHSCNMLF